MVIKREDPGRFTKDNSTKSYQFSSPENQSTSLFISTYKFMAKSCWLEFFTWVMSFPLDLPKTKCYWVFLRNILNMTMKINGYFAFFFWIFWFANKNLIKTSSSFNVQSLIFSLWPIQWKWQITRNSPHQWVKRRPNKFRVKEMDWCFGLTVRGKLIALSWIVFT